MKNCPHCGKPLISGEQCEALTPPKWYRKNGGRCPFRAIIKTEDGKYLCRTHAKQAQRLSGNVKCVGGGRVYKPVYEYLTSPKVRKQVEAAEAIRKEAERGK